MQKTFQKWLFLFVAMAFVVTFALSFYIQTRQAQENARRLIHLKIQDAIEQIDQNSQNQHLQREIRERQSLAKARALAWMIHLSPSLLRDRAEMEKIRQLLDVDELHISDAQGILIFSIPPANQGYNMASREQSRVFLPAIHDPEFALFQDLQAKGADGKPFQYAGVARLDAPGIVQIGYMSERFYENEKITSLENLAKGFRIGKDGRLLIAKEGKIVSIEREEWLGTSLETFGIPDEIAKQPRGTFSLKLEGVRKIGAFQKYGEYLIAGTLPANEVYLSRDVLAWELVIFYLVLFAVVFVLVSQLVERIVIRGILSVNRSLKKITEGDLNEIVDVRTNVEFASLSDGINATVSALRQAFAEASAQMERELELARAIQVSTLPSMFPAFPDRSEVDLYATMDTAKKVGGDFYDFLFVDSDHLAVMIADVSGKGIPAAMFMMTAKTQLKNLIKTGMEPSEIFSRANAYLCENNDTGMFVTAFLGILEISTGTFTYVNAGHLPPLWKPAANRPYEWLKSRASFVLGAIEGMDFEQHEIHFQAGSCFFLYTDGVTEAVNPEKELYRDHRLLETIHTLDDGKSLADMLSGIRQNLAHFAAGMEQSDDITMLILQYFGD
ncbi:MAG: SpoIIE family protein phosphatase [Planctomycetia bacterium]|nr:SpoIIE family protein phosphatase [Planctomycetia bacterium]